MRKAETQEGGEARRTEEIKREGETLGGGLQVAEVGFGVGRGRTSTLLAAPPYSH